MKALFIAAILLFAGSLHAEIHEDGKNPNEPDPRRRRVPVESSVEGAIAALPPTRLPLNRENNFMQRVRSFLSTARLEGYASVMAQTDRSPFHDSTEEQKMEATAIACHDLERRVQTSEGFWPGGTWGGAELLNANSQISPADAAAAIALPAPAPAGVTQISREVAGGAAPIDPKHLACAIGRNNVNVQFADAAILGRDWRSVQFSAASGGSWQLHHPTNPTTTGNTLANIAGRGH